MLLWILFSTVIFSKTIAQNSDVFQKGEISKTDNHTGDVWLNELNVSDSLFNFSLAHATFAAGAKLDWHIHPGGQYLLITEGTGFYQERGKSVQVVHKGEVIKCLPGVEHWHGATPETTFAYIGATPTQKGKTIWLKRVADEEYKNTNFTPVNAEQIIKNLSLQKWNWMAQKNVDSLETLFDEQAVFVHMGGSWGKNPELEVIKNGNIWYKKADIHSVSVNRIGNTAVLLNNITLMAVVNDKEVTNPFIVTEVYIEENEHWRLGSLSFTKQLTSDDTKH